MNCDMHVHSAFSYDSSADMAKYCQKAEQKKIDVFCFSEHVDHNKNDEGYGYYDADKFFGEFNMIKEKAKVEALSGIEFSEPHLYSDKLEALSKYPYDFIIGSVHYVNDIFPGSKDIERYTLKEFYDLYWLEILETVKSGGFDCLGHIDFPKRYFKALFYDEKIIIKIFETMLKNNIVLEINTSSIRKGLDEPMPGLTFLKLYSKCGGKYVTIGSDSHTEEELGEGIAYARELMSKADLRQVVFRKRKLEIV